MKRAQATFRTIENKKPRKANTRNTEDNIFQEWRDSHRIGARPTVNVASASLVPVKGRPKQMTLENLGQGCAFAFLKILAQPHSRVQQLQARPGATTGHSLGRGDAPCSILLLLSGTFSSKMRNRRQYWMWGWFQKTRGFYLRAWAGGDREGSECWQLGKTQCGGGRYLGPRGVGFSS